MVNNCITLSMMFFLILWNFIFYEVIFFAGPIVVFFLLFVLIVFRKLLLSGKFIGNCKKLLLGSVEFLEV